MEATDAAEKLALFRARVAIEPAVNAAVVIAAFGDPVDELQVGALVKRLSGNMRLLAANDMHGCEAMLVAQAHALQVIFTNLAQRAGFNLHRLDETERCLRLALKAQNQCRMTLETLATLKNPRVVVAQQTNIANGPQQVNNGPPSPGDGKDAHAHKSKCEIQQTELLEVINGERLDTGTAGAAIGADSNLATVGTIDRAANT